MKRDTDDKIKHWLGTPKWVDKRMILSDDEKDTKEKISWLERLFKIVGL